MVRKNSVFPIDARVRLGSVSVCDSVAKFAFLNARHFRAPNIAANDDECIIEWNQPYAAMIT